MDGSYHRGGLTARKAAAHMKIGETAPHKALEQTFAIAKM